MVADFSMGNLQALPSTAKRRILQLLQESTPSVSTAGRSQNQTSSAPGPLDSEQAAPPQQLPLKLEAPLLQPTPLSLPDAFCDGRPIRLPSGLAVVDNVLGEAALQMLKREADAALAEDSRAACFGSADTGPLRVRNLRGDTMRWLRRDEQLREGRPALAGLVEALLQLRPGLEAAGYSVRGRPSFQLACYPGDGARYVRHSDATANAATQRRITAIYYLNPDWEPRHEGQLAVYNVAHHTGARRELEAATVPASDPGDRDTVVLVSHMGPGEPMALVSPVGDRLVLFESWLDHEVLPTLAPRYAVTAWFSAPTAEELAAQHQGTAASATAPDLAPSLVTTAPPFASAGPPRAPETAATGPLLAGPSARPTGATSMEEPAPGAFTTGFEAGPSYLDNPARPPAAVMQEVWAPHSDVRNSAAAALGGSIPEAHTLLPPGHYPAAASRAAAAPDLDMAPITRPGQIFVSVAAYRDSEAQWTLASLFSAAARPEAVRVGVVWQADASADGGFVRLAGDQRWAPQVREVRLDYREAAGPCRARWLAQQLWDGEEFCLQVDSHMRFAPGWDVQLVEMLKEAERDAEHGRAVISTYPPEYEGEGPSAAIPSDVPPAVLCASHFDADGMLRLTARQLRSPPARPPRSLFWAAGFSFSRAQLFLEVPYDRGLPFLFYGEEAGQLVRMWTRGWDCFAPSATLAFHLWSRAHRPTFWEDMGPQPEAKAASQAKIRALLNGDSAPASSHKALALAAGSSAPYQLGTVRSLEQFYALTGVDFQQQRLLSRAQQGGLDPEEFVAA